MKLGMKHVEDSLVFADYRRRLDARAVLDFYGAENCHEEINKDGITVEIIHSCLLDRVEPHHANGDQNPSAACNVDKKLYTCYAYWSGDLFRLIQKMEGQGSLEGIAPVVRDFLGDSALASADFVAEVEKILASLAEGSYSVDLSTYNERILAPWAFVHPYLNERGIDNETASRLRIGWDERTNRITIPHFWKGKLVGWQARAIPDRPGQWPGTVPDQPKYKSKPGFPKSSTLYGYDLASPDHAVVVESPFSVIKAVALGVPNVVATFGAKVTIGQVELLRRFRKVTVWMDDDTAGRVAERRLVNNLYRHTLVDIVHPDPQRDLGDCCTREEVERKLASTEPAVLALIRYEQEGKR